MKQVMMQQGQVIVADIPAPTVQPGTVLVQVDHSCISSGTEINGLRQSGQPIWKKPEKIKKVARLVAAQGIQATRQLVEDKLAARSIGAPTGYAAAGIVLDVGEGITDIKVGDRVACAGAAYAHHAEIITVPRNLIVVVPDNLGLDEASTVTLGAIALQGVRRAGPTLGETFVVIGLGILGQITAQLLRINGCRVIGVDLVPGRIDLARRLGLDIGLHPDEAAQVIRLTEGRGADGVIVTAATPSDVVMASAFQMCRKKGRVVLVGDVGLNLKRADLYEKELDFLISTSYGPGRYDPQYEEQGHDYPLGYVRWTENRNMAEYVRLLAERKLDVKALIGAVYPLEQAHAAYQALADGADRPPLILLTYPRKVDADSRVTINPAARQAIPGAVRIGIIGAGSFAREVHLPNLKRMPEQYTIQAIMSRKGDHAAGAAQQFGAGYATSDAVQILNDPEVSAVLIATRHDQHAALTLAALQAGKHVLVEKPLALKHDDLEVLQAFFKSTQPAPILMTGYNRRFSPYARRIRAIVQGRRDPMIINYRMNAGYIPLDHWVHGPEGGGRNRGEACHIYDLFTYLTDSPMILVDAWTIVPQTAYYSRRDNFVATVAFEDGSVATLTYTALGSAAWPKERMEIYVEGTVIELDDYKRLTVSGKKGQDFSTSAPDKGHKAELEAFAQAIQTGGEWPIPLWQQIQAAEIALQVEDVL